MNDTHGSTRGVPAWMRVLDKGMLVFTALLFIYAVVDWRGWSPFERGYQPLRMVFLSAALLTQAAAGVLSRRGHALGFVLLAASMVLLVVSMTARD